MKKLIMILMASVLVFGLISCDSDDAENPYLTFKGAGPFSIKVDSHGWSGTVEFSKDAETWEPWFGEEVNAEPLSDGSCCLYFRGTGNSRIAGNYDSRWQITEGTAGCYGNIMTLLNYENPDNAKMDPHCYETMFVNCSGLTSAPELPAETLAESCYAYMFYNCSGLRSAPKLPAMNLAELCYTYMFYNCSGLRSAPKLPAEKLFKSCYSNMFYGCTGLKSVPVLPAKSLADFCYFEMFESCTSLKINNTGAGTLFLRMPSDIPEGAVSYMFNGTGGSYKDAPCAGGVYYYE